MSWEGIHLKAVKRDVPRIEVKSTRRGIVHTKDLIKNRTGREWEETSRLLFPQNLLSFSQRLQRWFPFFLARNFLIVVRKKKDFFFCSLLSSLFDSIPRISSNWSISLVFLCNLFPLKGIIGERTFVGFIPFSLKQYEDRMKKNKFATTTMMMMWSTSTSDALKSWSLKWLQTFHFLRCPWKEVMEHTYSIPCLGLYLILQN